jgi:predicted nucleotidyltransferase component of viral defense system
MIEPDEIVNMAQELKVNESNVQRDYIFGWTLAGIYSKSDLRNHLVFKGGNCLRKAYFEAARYSPDLDFATTGTLSQDYLVTELNKVCDFIQTNTGVEFSKDRTRVDEKKGADPVMPIDKLPPI